MATLDLSDADVQRLAIACAATAKSADIPLYYDCYDNPITGTAGMPKPVARRTRPESMLVPNADGKLPRLPTVPATPEKKARLRWRAWLARAGVPSTLAGNLRIAKRTDVDAALEAHAVRQPRPLVEGEEENRAMLRAAGVLR